MRQLRSKLLVSGLATSLVLVLAAPAAGAPGGNGKANGQGGGANQPNPHIYSGTGNPTQGLPSGNGASQNNNGNRPAAGTVGKADDKFPPGQAGSPAGSDRNNGYECDGNQGIGQMNPAHSGCAQSTVNPPGTNPPGVNPPGTNPPGTNPPGTAGNPPGGGVSPAEEQGNAPGGAADRTVLRSSPDSVGNRAVPVANVSGKGGEQQSKAGRKEAGHGLPFTGSEPLAIALLGLLTLGVAGGLGRFLRTRPMT